MVNITTEVIINKIREDFIKIYRPFSKFEDSGVIWDECIKAVNDIKLMNNIIFCNDILQIPPTKVFLKANNVLTNELTSFDKKSIGAFWGFVFKFVLNYKSQKDDVPINTKGVKKAACFSDAVSEVEIV